MEAQLETLGDIREIMAALRNTAVIEVTRLRRLVPAQQELLAAIERAAADFLACHPQLAMPPAGAPTVVVVGSERGFCGDFNDMLQAPLARVAPAGSDARLIVVGRRLATRLRPPVPVAAVVEGASVADDVEDVVERLAAALLARQQAGEAALLPLALHLVHHAGNGQGAHVVHHRPFSALARADRPPATPLRLQLAPQQMFAALIEQYLLAALHGMLNAALLAENQRRLQHLDGAMRRIDRRCEGLATRRNALRQEEITEEIEVILLSTADDTQASAGWAAPESSP